MVRCRPARQDPASLSGLFGGGTPRRVVAGQEPSGTHLADSRDRVRRVRRLQSPVQPRFPSVTGTPLRNRNWRRDAFDSAVEALGLKITPHNLRDTAASLAIQEGASVVAVARLLGHESGSAMGAWKSGSNPDSLRPGFAAARTRRWRIQRRSRRRPAERHRRVASQRDRSRRELCGDRQPDRGRPAPANPGNRLRGAKSSSARLS
jgi:hypothetical protein